MTPAPTAPSIPDDAVLRDVYAWVGPSGLSAVVDEVVPVYARSAVELRGRVVDGDERDRGQWTRWLRVDFDTTLVASHAYLVLDEDVRRQGFATAYNAHLDAAYREWGVAHVEMRPEQAGSFVWATDRRMRLHANHPYPPASAHHPLTAQLEAGELRALARRGLPRIREHVDAGRIDAALLDELDLLPEEVGVHFPPVPDHALDGVWTRPWQLAAWGREHAWTGEDGRETWAGREALLGNWWVGWRPVDGDGAEK